jgi:hypothetical protein
MGAADDMTNDRPQLLVGYDGSPSAAGAIE